MLSMAPRTSLVSIQQNFPRDPIFQSNTGNLKRVNHKLLSCDLLEKCHPVKKAPSWVLKTFHSSYIWDLPSISLFVTHHLAVRLRGNCWNPGMKAKRLIGMAVVAVVCVTVYTQLTVFVIPPIGVPAEGKTIIIPRQGSTQFIDSPDGMCERKNGGVSLLCRGFAIASVLRDATILVRLPYSSTLYSISTGGKTYDR